MKKLLIAASLLIGMIAGAMVLSSFSEPKNGNVLEGVMKIDPPTYWEGNAWLCTEQFSHPYLYIKVYQVENQCNAYYAIVEYYSGGGSRYNGEKCWVKVNEDYNPSSVTCPYNKKYYITCGSSDWYFNM